MTSDIASSAAFKDEVLFVNSFKILVLEFFLFDSIILDISLFNFADATTPDSEIDWLSFPVSSFIDFAIPLERFDISR